MTGAGGQGQDSKEECQDPLEELGHQGECQDPQEEGGSKEGCQDLQEERQVFQEEEGEVKTGNKCLQQ